MSINLLENNLANFKRLLLIWAGAAATLLAVAFVDVPNSHSSYFLGWYGVWLIIQVGTISPSLMLLYGSGFRKLPFAERLNTIFSYLVVSWIVLVAFVINSGMFFRTNIPSSFGFANFISVTVTLTQLYEFVGIIGASIAIAYWILQRKYLRSPDAMFP